MPLRLGYDDDHRPEADSLALMFPKKPNESFEDASRLAFEYHVGAAPVALPIISLCLAGLIWWNPPNAWFVVFNVISGIGLAISWAYQMNGKTGAALIAVLAFTLTSLCGLQLDDERNFNVQLAQGLGLMSLPFYIFALTQRRRPPPK